MRDNHLFHRICKEVGKFESNVEGWVFYFDEIKPVIQVKGDLQ